MQNSEQSIQPAANLKTVEGEIFDDEDIGVLDQLVDNIGSGDPKITAGNNKSEDISKTNNQTEKSRSNHNKMNGEQNNDDNKPNGNGGNDKKIKVWLNVNEKDWSILQFVADAQKKVDAAELVQDLVVRMSEGAREKISVSLSSYDVLQKVQAAGRR